MSAGWRRGILRRDGVSLRGVLDAEPFAEKRKGLTGGAASGASPMLSVSVAGGRISWRENHVSEPGSDSAAEPPTAVIVPGLGLGSRFYEGSYAPFATAGVRLVVPDLPGWGRTPGPLTGLTPEQTASYLMRVAAVLPVEPAVWVGHSLGAQAVVELAVRRPELVAGLVLAGPTGSPRRLDTVRQAGALAVEATRVSLHVMRGVARDYLRTPPQRYIGTWLRHGGHDLASLLPQVSCPVLVLVGESDPVSTDGFVRLLLRRLPEARVERVAGATHALPRGNPDEFNVRVLRFVGEVTV